MEPDEGLVAGASLRGGVPPEILGPKKVHMGDPYDLPEI